VPDLREQRGAEIGEKRFRRAHLVSLCVRVAVSLWRLRFALLGLPAVLSGHKQFAWL